MRTNTDSYQATNSTVSFPFSIKDSGQLLLRAEINGAQGFFIIDTGSSISIVEKSRQKYFGLEISGRKKATTAGGFPLDLLSTSEAPLSIGNVLLGQFSFELLPLKDISKSVNLSQNAKVHGIIGANILRATRAIIDYDRKEIKMQPKGVL